MLTPLESARAGCWSRSNRARHYPLSLNALVAGCNQKTAREPVINATEAEVLTAVDGLKSLSLVFEGSGSRVVRFEHNMARVYALPSASVALLAHADAARPADGGRAAPAQRAAAPLCRHLVGRGLPRRAGCQGAAACGEAAARRRRARGALGAPAVRRGLVDVAAAPAGEAGVSAGEIAALKAEQARLADELAQLRHWCKRIGAELGIDPRRIGARRMRFDLPEQKKLVHQMRIPIRWGDMDAMGHVNNTCTSATWRSSRIDWLFQVGGPPDLNGEGFVIVNAFCNFIRQLEYPGEVLAQARTSPTRAQQLRHLRHAGAQRPARRALRHGRCDDGVAEHPARRKTVPLPDWLRAIVA